MSFFLMTEEEVKEKMKRMSDAVTKQHLARKARPTNATARKPRDRYPWRVEEALPEKPGDREKRIAREERRERQIQDTHTFWIRAFCPVHEEGCLRRKVLYELTWGIEQKEFCKKPDREQRRIRAFRKKTTKERTLLVQDLCTNLREGLEL